MACYNVNIRTFQRNGMKRLSANIVFGVVHEADGDCLMPVGCVFVELGECYATQQGP